MKRKTTNVTNDGNTALILAIDNNQQEVVEYLLKNGANPNITNKFGTTVLMFATDKNQQEVVEALLKNGANPNITNKVGNTALMIATDKNHIKIAETLLEKGADPNITNKDGNTALILATNYKYINIIEMLITNKANIKDDILENLLENYWEESDINLKSKWKESIISIFEGISKQQWEIILSKSSKLIDDILEHDDVQLFKPLFNSKIYCKNINTLNYRLLKNLINLNAQKIIEEIISNSSIDINITFPDNNNIINPSYLAIE